MWRRYFIVVKQARLSYVGDCGVDAKDVRCDGVCGDEAVMLVADGAILPHDVDVVDDQ